MEENKLNDMSELFRKVRKENKLNLKQFAERMEANHGYLGMVESGKVIPGKLIISKFAKAFEIDVDKILELRKQIVTPHIETNQGKNVEENKPNKDVQVILDFEEHKNRTKDKQKGEIHLGKMKSISELFLNVRKANNLTLKKMAKELKSSAPYISQVETGKKIPAKKFIAKMAETFELPLEVCLELTGYNQKQEEKSKGTEADKSTNKMSSITDANDGDQVDGSEIMESPNKNTEVTSSHLVNEGKEEDVMIEEKQSSFSKQSEKVTFTTVEKAEINLSPEKEYVTDIAEVWREIVSYGNSYEFKINIEGQNQCVALTIDKDKMTISL
ncbi:helix-turn-helix domain-containing protein [[Brevibacterium] frigoritolerans]|nr:helix-turn-helix domain-containing protein [Peribacillus frigoritolerans]